MLTFFPAVLRNDLLNRIFYEGLQIIGLSGSEEANITL